jgi:hypothetical protein
MIAVADVANGLDNQCRDAVLVNPMPDVAPHPLRRSVFAVWRWPPWVRSIILAVMIPAYVLSAAPVAYLMNATETRNETTIAWFNLMYFPLDFLAQRSEWFVTFYQWEFELIESQFGNIDR